MEVELEEHHVTEMGLGITPEFHFGITFEFK